MNRWVALNEFLITITTEDKERIFEGNWQENLKCSCAEKQNLKLSCICNKIKHLVTTKFPLKFQKLNSTSKWWKGRNPSNQSIITKKINGRPNLKPRFSEIIAICMCNWYQGFDGVYVLRFHFRNWRCGWQKRKSRQCLDIGISFQLKPIISHLNMYLINQ